MTTAVALKVYSCVQVPVGQTIHSYVADDAVLEWLPQETVACHYRFFIQLMESILFSFLLGS